MQLLPYEMQELLNGAARTLPLIRHAGRDAPINKKPLCGNKRGKDMSGNKAFDSRLPRARGLLQATLLPPVSCSRGQV